MFHSITTSVIAVTPELVGSVSFGGLRAYCVGYAVDDSADDRLIYLGLVGYRTAVRGVWAALLEHQPIEIAGQLFRRAEGTYLYRAVQLPESGLENMALLHHQATVNQLEPNQAFYLLNASDDPPHARFFAMLNRAVVAPMLPHWAEWLWRQGYKKELITRLDATRGTFAWRIHASDEAWLEIIQRGIQRHALLADQAET
ncbi:MAG: hypothetical protein IT331_08210 [Anaerolineae bacterium]|nr:hypothetical protein [Anaerolineae bacterium]